MGHDDGVLVLEPSAFATCGTAAVGMARQWCGRLGKVANCPVALSLGDVSAKGHPRVDMRLSLAKEWPQDKTRLDKVGVPPAPRGYRTRHQLALAMREQHGASLPQGWMAGDADGGRPYWCRRRLASGGERSRLAVPSHTVLRDLETPVPQDSGRGRRPQRPWPRVDAWRAALTDGAWQRIDVRDGATGPLVVDGVKRRVGARTPRRQPGDEER